MVDQTPGYQGELNFPPATTAEQMENQLISESFELVRKRIRNGTASAQETVHFLKLGSTHNQLDKQRKKAEVALLEARVDEIKARRDNSELTKQALDAIRSYQGLGDDGQTPDVY